MRARRPSADRAGALRAEPGPGSGKAAHPSRNSFGPESSPPLPWTDEQVTALNRFQESPHFHPFTCGSGNRSDAAHIAARKRFMLTDDGQLIATRTGWICPACDYRQEWAHAAMFWGAGCPDGWLSGEDLRGIADTAFGGRGQPTTFAAEHGLCDETVLAFLRGARPASEALAAAMGYERRCFYRYRDRDGSPEGSETRSGLTEGNSPAPEGHRHD